MGDETVDYEHMLSCRDRFCLYCDSDQVRHVTENERFLNAWAATMWDVGALEDGHPFKQAA